MAHSSSSSAHIARSAAFWKRNATGAHVGSTLCHQLRCMMQSRTDKLPMHGVLQCVTCCFHHVENNCARHQLVSKFCTFLVPQVGRKLQFQIFSFSNARARHDLTYAVEQLCDAVNANTNADVRNSRGEGTTTYANARTHIHANTQPHKQKHNTTTGHTNTNTDTHTHTSTHIITHARNTNRQHT